MNASFEPSGSRESCLSVDMETVTGLESLVSLIFAVAEVLSIARLVEVGSAILTVSEEAIVSVIVNDCKSAGTDAGGARRRCLRPHIDLTGVVSGGPDYLDGDVSGGDGVFVSFSPARMTPDLLLVRQPSSAFVA